MSPAVLVYDDVNSTTEWLQEEEQSFRQEGTDSVDSTKGGGSFLDNNSIEPEGGRSSNPSQHTTIDDKGKS